MPDAPSAIAGSARSVVVHAGRVALRGDLAEPPAATGLIVFAHSAGSGRDSPRNQRVARALVHAGFATLLFDLLTVAEEEHYTRQLGHDVALLADRLIGALGWVYRQRDLGNLPLGVFGAGAGAAAALIASTRVPAIRAVVSRSGRPDLANLALPLVRCPTLLIVGGQDTEVLELNHRAMRRMRAPTKLHVVPDANGIFDEPGALDEVARYACSWFRDYVTARTRTLQDPSVPGTRGSS
jgi:predicted alpha/beta-hydrolase family hydrolase